MGPTDRFLVTGAMGCLGAWTVRILLDQGIPVTAVDVSEDRRRLRLLASEEELENVRFVRADITDSAALTALVREQEITHIVHLAALQIPFCRADPVLGARVNVVGTVNVFEAVLANRSQVRGLVYASSAAVFGPAELYPEGFARDDSPLLPGTMYGVFKQANEGTARIYGQEHGLPSVGLRPVTVYGVGRDQGLTSAPTVAMLAAAAGLGAHIGYGGSSQYHLASDVARVAVAAARSNPESARTLNVGGSSAHMSEVVAAIEAAAPEVRGRISFDDAELPFPPRFDSSGLDALVGAEYTPLDVGIRQTVDAFRELLARGLVEPPVEAT